MAKRSSKNLELKNPHSVYEAIKVRPQDVVEVVVRSHKPEGMWDKVVTFAIAKGVAVRTGVSEIQPKQSRQRGKSRGASKSNSFKQERVGSAWGVVKSQQNLSIEHLFDRSEFDHSEFDHSEDAEQNSNHETDKVTNKNGLWLALDCLQDPHNVGAIFRTAAFFGVRGIIATHDRSAPLNATVYDVASGGMEHVPFAVEVNLSRTLSKAKESGLWILGASEHASEPLSAIQTDRPWLLVIGNEEKGLRRLTRECCDTLCSIPSAGKVTSLNASAAAAVMISHLSPNIS